MALADPPLLPSCLINPLHASQESLRAPSNASEHLLPLLFDDSPSALPRSAFLSEFDQFNLIEADAFTTLNVEPTALIPDFPSTVHDPNPPDYCPPAQPLEDLDEDAQDAHDVGSRSPFHKWMKQLHKRKSKAQQDADEPPVGLDVDNLEATSLPIFSRRSQHRKSESRSSIGFVTGVRSTTASLVSGSVAGPRWRNASRSRCQSRTGRSSLSSLSHPRISEDSTRLDRAVVLDPGFLNRSIQRRRILEEIISTEEAYIGDVRFLLHVYSSVLSTLPELSPRVKKSISKNLDDMIRLHDELLGDLHRAIPDSEYTQLDFATVQVNPRKRGKGHRQQSADSNLDLKDGLSWARRLPGMISDPQVAAEVAKVFTRNMSRFFIYKEYGAKYESMIRNLATANGDMPELGEHENGLELLDMFTRSSRSNRGVNNKSLMIGDLYVKPIQRVCRYPLLLAELLKYTPASDCPNSHMEIETALLRLREATVEINRATDDGDMRIKLQKTWQLQDRIVLPGQKIDAESKSKVRSLGHIQMCGALHVCWQTGRGVEGKYMICLLYKENLCLAAAGKFEPIYTLKASIDLNGAWVEEVDNGRGGLQCHTAPFSWKLVFEDNNQLYEMIMTACTAAEEKEWRDRLRRPLRLNQDALNPRLFTFLALNMKSLGPVFGKPGTITRRISIHRATTVGSGSSQYQVILKNTSGMRNRSSVAATINRSQSLLSTNARLPILVPSRSERIRLELLLSDVWSRDLLPFPGMLSRSRSEHLVRTSANTVRRKLSNAGSSLSRRHGVSPRNRINEEPETSEESQAGPSPPSNEEGKNETAQTSISADSTSSTSPEPSAHPSTSTVWRFHEVEVDETLKPTDTVESVDKLLQEKSPERPEFAATLKKPRKPRKATL